MCIFSDGNGFKTSTMRLGADVIVFSRASRNGYFFFSLFLDVADFHIVEVGYISYRLNCLKGCCYILFIYIQLNFFLLCVEVH